MLREIRDLGFEYAELSHGIRVSLLPGILEAVEAGEIKISSLHNFCPLPMGVSHAAPNLYQFSDERPRQRELAIKHTLKTFEFAGRVNAPLVVLHLGSMDLKDYTGKLCDDARTRPAGHAQIREALRRSRQTREAKKESSSKTFMSRSGNSCPKPKSADSSSAAKTGRRSRNCRWKATSSFSSASSNSPHIWSTGTTAATRKSRRTSASSTMRCIWRSLAPRLAGFHVHDVIFPAGDHAAPGTGTVDYAALKPFVKPEHIKVFELSPSLPVEAVKCGVMHVKAIWGDE